MRRTESLKWKVKENSKSEWECTEWIERHRIPESELATNGSILVEVIPWQKIVKMKNAIQMMIKKLDALRICDPKDTRLQVRREKSPVDLGPNAEVVIKDVALFVTIFNEIAVSMGVVRNIILSKNYLPNSTLCKQTIERTMEWLNFLIWSDVAKEYLHSEIASSVNCDTALKGVVNSVAPHVTIRLISRQMVMNRITSYYAAVKQYEHLRRKH